MKIVVLNHRFEKDDICSCKASYFDKKNNLIYECKKIFYCEIRGLNSFKSQNKNFNSKIKNAVLCKIQVIKKIGSKAINYDNN